MQVVHVYQEPQQHLEDFELLCASLRRVHAHCAHMEGVASCYGGVGHRLCRQFSSDMACPATRLQCVALYSSVVDSLRSGAHSAVLQAVDAYLQE